MRVSWKKFWVWLAPQLIQEPLKKLVALATIVGVIYAIFNSQTANRYTVRQLEIAGEQLELATRPYLYVTDSVWREIKVVSGDVGTQTRFTVQNLGGKPARWVHIKKDFMIRIAAPKGKDRLKEMQTPSKIFNPKQEMFWNEYIPYREAPIREIANFFRSQRNWQSEKEIESYFNEKWKKEGKDYSCEVYGPVDSQYKVEPWIIASESHDIWTGRSTGRPAKAFIQAGGDILVTYLVLEYQGLLKRKSNYELHYIAYFDNAKPWKSDGISYSLTRYTTWDDLEP